MSEATLQVRGMSCSHCVSTVENAVKGVGASAKVDLAGGLVAVEFDDGNVTLEAIKEAIEDQGYDVV